MNEKKYVILLLEDDLGTLKNIGDFLERNGYEVIRCCRIDQANERFQGDKKQNSSADQIDCIVTDLNMNDEWLGEYKDESTDMTLSGWVWLYRFVYPIRPEMPTVIYSKFVDELHERIGDTTDPQEREVFERNNIKCLSKGNTLGTGRIGLLDKIKEALPATKE